MIGKIFGIIKTAFDVAVIFCMFGKSKDRL
jgi:hypothetical protein